MTWQVNKKQNIRSIYTRLVVISVFLFIGVYIAGQATNALGKDEMMPVVFILLLAWLKTMMSSYLYRIEVLNETIYLSSTNLFGLEEKTTVTIDNIKMNNDLANGFRRTQSLHRLRFYNEEMLIGQITERRFGWEKEDLINIETELSRLSTK